MNKVKKVALKGWQILLAVLIPVSIVAGVYLTLALVGAVALTVRRRGQRDGVSFWQTWGWFIRSPLCAWKKLFSGAGTALKKVLPGGGRSVEQVDPQRMAAQDSSFGVNDPSFYQPDKIAAEDVPIAIARRTAALEGGN
jgi:hypothetical protein